MIKTSVPGIGTALALSAVLAGVGTLPAAARPNDGAAAICKNGRPR
jgi:hypothetical protein